VPGTRLQPEWPREAARMNQLLGIADWYLMPQVSATITFNRYVKPRFKLPVDEAAITAAIPNARLCIGEIARLLDGHPWLAGDALSLADLLIAAHLSMLAQTPEGVQLMQEHANLGAWLARMEARPSMQAIRALPTAAASGVALIVPIPGIVISLRTAWSSRAMRVKGCNAFVERTTFAPQVFDQQANAGAQRLDPVFVGKDRERAAHVVTRRGLRISCH
jgi:glutathione S-transferase-like protein